MDYLFGKQVEKLMSARWARGDDHHRL